MLPRMREIVTLHAPEPPKDQYSLYYYHLNQAKLLAAVKTVNAGFP